jgi:tRNA A-37 threonylcarbamoyl transferase component Bud32
MIKKINNYQILSKIASGGMSEVYLAVDTETGKKVALKILDAKLSIDPEYLHRFKKEASICQQLDHKNIVKILSYGTFEESYYIAYEYIEGITLDKLLRQKDLTIAQIEKISIQLLAGLSYAHSKNIIHRDIKPSNIIIEKGVVKILDFGIAKQELAATVTKSGLFMGSPHYVSPEQIEGHDIDYRSDIYSFGIVLYEMIEGRVPFSADTPWGIIRAHLDKKAPEITKDTPSYLKEVVLKCLSKRKEDRFKSANEIISVIVNKEERGKRTIIIENKWEKLEKILEKEDGIDEWEGKNTGRKEFLIPMLITLTSILFICFLVLAIIFALKDINKNVVQAAPTTTVLETTVITTAANNATTTVETIVTTTQETYKTTTTTAKSIDYTQMDAEYAFITDVYNLLNEYELAFNHMNVYHKEGWIFNDPNEIALEETFLIKLLELSNELENFPYPGSLIEGRGNLVNISKQLCDIKASMINCMKNNDYSGCLNYFNSFSQALDSLYYNYNQMSDAYNNKYN